MAAIQPSIVPSGSAARRPRTLMRRFVAPWAAVVAVGALVLGVIPNAFAAPGDTAREAITIGGEGRFSGTAAPTKSRWYLFSYAGNNRTVTINVSYQPADSNQLDFQLYTGSADNPRPESATPTRSGSMLSQTFTDPTARDILIEVRNNHSDRSVSFVGTVTPPDVVNSPTPAATPYFTPTPAPSSPSAATAITVGADGAYQGSIGTRAAVWYRFWYGNPGAEAQVVANFSPSGANAELNIYTGADVNTLSQQSGPARRDSGGDVQTRTINLSTPQFVYFTIVNSNDAQFLAYSGRVSPAFAPPTTPTPSPTAAAATATATPAAQPTSTPQAAPALPRDTRYFSETGYRIDDDDIFAFFQGRGRIDTFGFPVSRTFTFLGCRVQMFQRLIAQKCSGNTVALINMLDPDIFPYTRVNGSTFPSADEGLKNSTPKPSDANYGSAIQDFVRLNAPDQFSNEPVNFGSTFFSSITPAMAGTDNPGLLGLFDLEVWGAPISRPQPDPANGSFIYQRFQRGIMHYTRGQGTRGILLADYLKAIFLGPDLAARTGANLPGDLRDQAAGSKYFAQYCPGATRWVCRPNDLPTTDFTFAFERG